MTEPLDMNASTETAAPTPPALAIVVKGYPRLSETFVAQELLGLQQRGVPFEIWSLRHPTDTKTHALHDKIQARRRYLPEYLHHEPLRVARSIGASLLQRGFWRAVRLWLRDLRRDRTVNRVRRFGQAAVLARELPAETRFLYAHFLHTPASVTRYAAVIRGLDWGFSAHAKDIWTSPAWEKREKIRHAAFGATCTASGARHLNGLVGVRAGPRPEDRDGAGDVVERPISPVGPVRLLYHGLDLSRFPPPPDLRPARDGRDAPLRLMSVGRLVAKKGYDDLLRALALLPQDLSWRLEHIGGGPLSDALKAQAAEAGLTDRILWRGAQAQDAVIAALREADLFVLPSRIAPDGDRDGLPNVLMEAASQKLAIVSTEVSAIPEFILSPEHGALVPPGDAAALAEAIEALGRAPARRAAMAERLYARLVEAFSADHGIDALAELIRPHLGPQPHGRAAETSGRRPSAPSGRARNARRAG